MLGWLKTFWTAKPPPDGFGQSRADDMRFLARFARSRRVAVTWRAPTVEERAEIDGHPILGRFVDTVGVADVGGMRWIVRDRMWNGWPDPPEYVFFALQGGAIWSAADFDGWPRRWTRPPAPGEAADLAM